MCRIHHKPHRPIPPMETTLRKLAVVQEKYLVLIPRLVLAFTAIMAFGSLQMELDPSFDGMMSEDLEEPDHSFEIG